MKDKPIVSYLLWAFGLGWALQVLASWLALNEALAPEMRQLGFTLALSLAMFAPLAAALLSGTPLRSLGWKPKLRGNWRGYLAAWLGPFLLAALGAALYYLLFPSRFDTSDSYYLSTLTEEQLLQYEMQALPASFFILVSAVASIFYAPLLNTFLAIGEEAGWRGCLYPALMERHGRTRGLLLGGVVWGAWHWPVMLLTGYEYGLKYVGSPWLGPLLFCLVSAAMGILLNRLYEKTGSLWAPALGHGAINAAAGIPILFLDPAYADRLTVGPLMVGVIGGLPMFLAALYLLPKKAPAPADAAE